MTGAAIAGSRLPLAAALSLLPRQVRPLHVRLPSPPLICTLRLRTVNCDTTSQALVLHGAQSLSMRVK